MDGKKQTPRIPRRAKDCSRLEDGEMRFGMVSVVVLTHNSSGFVERCMDSILSQNFSGPFEVLVGDDASTDGTVEILAEYKKKHPNAVRVFAHEKHLGVIENLRKTGRNAVGEHVFLCDSDDFWTDPCRMHRMLDLMDGSEDMVLVHSGYRSIGPDGEVRSETEEGVSGDVYEILMEKGCLFPPSAVCIRGDLFRLALDDLPWTKEWSAQDYALFLYVSRFGAIGFDPAVSLSMLHRPGSSVSMPEEMGRYRFFRMGSWRVRRHFLLSYSDQIEPRRRERLLRKCWSKEILFLFSAKDYNAIRRIRKDVGFSSCHGRAKIILACCFSDSILDFCSMVLRK